MRPGRSIGCKASFGADGPGDALELMVRLGLILGKTRYAWNISTRVHRKAGTEVVFVEETDEAEDWVEETATLHSVKISYFMLFELYFSMCTYQNVYKHKI